MGHGGVGYRRPNVDRDFQLISSPPGQDFDPFEGVLHAWIVRQCNKRKPVTQRVVIQEIKELYASLHDLTD